MQKISNFKSLSGRLLFIVLLSSSVMTTLLTGFNLYLDYRMELQSQQAELGFIQNSIIRSIERSLWILDRQQTSAQIEGIMTIPAVYAVQLTDPTGQVLFSNQKNFDPTSKLQDTYPLFYTGNSDKILVGYLSINYTRDFIYAKLRTKIVSIFATQGIKTFIISFFLFWVFSHFLTRHLSELVSFLGKNKNLGSPGTPKLRFHRDPTNEYSAKETVDEFDLVENAINEAITESQNKVREIEELKELALRSSRAKGMLIKNISHDMRTPLNALLGSLDLIKEQLKPGEDSRLVYELQHKSIHFLSHMINDLLDLAKLEAGEMRLEENKIEAREFFLEIQAQAKVYCADFGGLLSMTIDHHMPQFLVTDRTRLKQILINIIQYCIRRTEQGTTFINVHYSAGDKKLKIGISDSGHYLTEDHVPYVFEPFSLVTEGGTGNHKPSALGLSVSKRLIEFFKGNIIFTRTLAGGSIFTLTVPVREPEVTNEASYTFNENAPLHEAKILLAEDTIENQILLKAYFKKTPYELHIANNGKEAIEHFKRNKFDVILMDLDMPVMNGYEAVEEIRKIESEFKKSQTFITAVSAFTGKSDVDKAFVAGVNDYISKPISKASIIEYIEALRRKQNQSQSAGTP